MEDAVEQRRAVFASRPTRRTRSVADRVAARYAKAPTYSEMLANEARNVARAAEAAAVAAGEARDAAQAILVGLDIDREARICRARTLSARASVATRVLGRRAPSYETSSRHERLSHYRGGRRRRRYTAKKNRSPRPATARQAARVSPRTGRHAQSPSSPGRGSAPRGIRPRASRSQLRIFEVEQETISTEPAVEPVLPEWSPDPPRRFAIGDRSGLDPPPHGSSRFRSRVGTAVRGNRLRPAAPNRVARRSLDGRPGRRGLDCRRIPRLCSGLRGLHRASSGRQTGIDWRGQRRSAPLRQSISCSFSTSAPTRRACATPRSPSAPSTMKIPPARRCAAASQRLLLAVIPFGLGILWAFFDDDRLGWHDRISRTYQRSYR